MVNLITLGLCEVHFLSKDKTPIFYAFKIFFSFLNHVHCGLQLMELKIQHHI